VRKAPRIKMKKDRKSEYPIPATMIGGQVLHKNWRINPTRPTPRREYPMTKENWNYRMAFVLIF
jgi:hypothetical protein